MLYEVDLVHTLVEVDNDFVWLEYAAVHAYHKVVLEALLGLLEEELHIVCLKISEQSLNNLVLEMWR